MIICDLDGTLCDTSARDHYAEQGKWDAFFAGIPNDPPNPMVLRFLQFCLSDGVPIVFVTGRGEEYRKESRDWLISADPRFADCELYMRPLKDRREDYKIKKEIYETKIKPFHEVDLVLEDRSSVVKLWRSLGLECWQVASGEF